MERKNAIITGGAGFIGSHLSERLLKEGFDNVYLIDNLVRTENLRNVQDNPKIKFLYGDVSQSRSRDVFMSFTVKFSTPINTCSS